MNKLKEWAQGKDNTSEWLKTVINGMWIPRSERLPSENDEYIITMGKDSFDKEGYVTWAMFDKLKKKFYFPGGRVNYYIAVTAWMPRPKPWKGAEDGNKWTVTEVRSILECAIGEVEKVIPSDVLEQAVAYLTEYENLKSEYLWEKYPEAFY